MQVQAKDWPSGRRLMKVVACVYPYSTYTSHLHTCAQNPVLMSYEHTEGVFSLGRSIGHAGRWVCGRLALPIGPARNNRNLALAPQEWPQVLPSPHGGSSRQGQNSTFIVRMVLRQNHA